MLKIFTAMLQNDDGQGLVEYALIIGLVSIVSIASLQILGKKTNNSFTNTGNILP